MHVKAGSGGAGASATLEEMLTSVQQRLEEVELPTAKELRGGKWATPELLLAIHKNPVLSWGLRQPVCQAALELMQVDPAEAMRRHQDNPEVITFLTEFGKVIGAHFDSLASKKGSVQEKFNWKAFAGNVAKRPGLGPFYQLLVQDGEGALEPNELLDQQVERILEDNELTAMLLDPGMQQVMLDCSDPEKFARYMRDPVVSKKLRRLQEAGLVRTLS